jgi:pimeloyl-ACP methyl ester carboxylesterase
MDRLLKFNLTIFLILISFISARSQQVAVTDYKSDSVEYDNADKSVHLGATFSYPDSKGPFITAILISGSGLQDRDEKSPMLNYRPFATISDYLVRNGYAVLRVDDRGVGKSRGDYRKATSMDFADDVLASIQYLLTRKEVDPKKIGVIGHSEGGFIAPIVSVKWPPLSFIISLAGTGVPGSAILLKQQTDPVKTMASKAAYDAFYELTEKTLNIIHDNPTATDSAILSQVITVYRDWKSKQPDSILIPLKADKATGLDYAGQIKMELIPWLRYFITTDPDQYWSKVKCPVLILNGKEDIQVYAEQNTSAISDALRKGGNNNFSVHIIPGLNHLFLKCNSCTFEEYFTLKDNFSQEVLEIMKEWLNNTIRK